MKLIRGGISFKDDGSVTLVLKPREAAALTKFLGAQSPNSYAQFGLTESEAENLSGIYEQLITEAA